MRIAPIYLIALVLAAGCATTSPGWTETGHGVVVQNQHSEDVVVKLAQHGVEYQRLGQVSAMHSEVFVVPASALALPGMRVEVCFPGGACQTLREPVASERLRLVVKSRDNLWLEW